MTIGMGSRAKSARISLLAGSSLAFCLALPNTAHAACSPNPTPANGTVTCSGTDGGNLVVNTSNTTVNVLLAATVASVKSITISNVGPFSPTFNSVTINDNGAITGGLTVESGIPVSGNAYAPTNTVTLNVSATGSIGGATAIALTSDGTAIFGGGIAGITIDNAGSIKSTSGAAIVSNGSNAGIYSLNNRSTGVIGAIQSGVGTLTNAGTIDGGANSAIAFGDRVTGSNTSFGGATWTNTGTIKSNSGAATLDLRTVPFSGPFFTNSGTIANSGSGSAISYAPGVNGANSLTNAASGTISSVGGAAIVSTGGLSLTNAGTITGAGTAINVAGLTLSGSGTINGSVIVTGSSNNRIDLSGSGTVNGNLTLGGGDDTVIVTGAPGGASVPGISGTVDAGGGFDRIIYQITGDTTIATTPALPASFEALGLRVAVGKTVTLGSAVNLTSPLDIGGTPNAYGTITLANQGTITANGPALTNIFGFGTVALNNSGTITATLAQKGDYAILLGQGAITNSGTITANGGNGILGFGSVTNSGSITADGVAVIANSGFTNSGSITSRASFGVNLFGNVGTAASNTGTISGATAGVVVSGFTLTNSGTIGASGGPGVALAPYGSLVNQAGGIVNNGIMPGPGYTFTFNSTISNAGTINGGVNLGTTFGAASNNTFVALDGGVVNGDLVLGSGGDRFVTSLTNSGPGAFAGVTGKVTGGPNETLIYRVDADTTTTLATPSGIFSTVGYDLGNNAKLTLTNATASSTPQNFTGSGSVSLSGDFSGNGAQTLFDLTRQSPRATTFNAANAIALSSSGKLSVTNGNANLYANGLVALVGSSSSFTNSGTVTVQDTATRVTGSALPNAIVDNGGGVTNSGTLSIGGVVGIFGSVAFGSTSSSTPTITKSGSITQIAGARDATGVSGSFNLTNTGTIATAGPAIRFSNDNGVLSTVTNSGTISSSRGPAISDNPNAFFAYFGGDGTIVNKATGTITGATAQPAIVLVGGVVDNAGTINGDVRFGAVSGQLSYYTPSGSTYIARGGTLNGNLSFGAGDDTLIVFGNTTGITGRIDAGGGTNTYAQAFTSSATIDASQQTLPATFQKYAIGASGAGTTLTLTGPSAGLSTSLSLFGNGTIDNQANVNAGSVPGANVVKLGQQNAALGLSTGLTFINEAKLADGVTGSVSSFTNSGSIGSTALQGVPVSLGATDGAAFSFTNSGTIAGPSASAAQFFLTPTVSIFDSGNIATLRPTATINNSGTIGGSIAVGLSANSATFTNSGRIDGVATPFNGGVTAVSLSIGVLAAQQSAPSADSSTAFTNAATGILKGNATVSSNAATLSLTNAGSISGALSGTQTAATVFVPGPPNTGGTYTTLDQASASLVNSGTITDSALDNAAFLNGRATGATATNSGTITAKGTDENGLAVFNQTTGSNSVTVSNSGTISATGGGGSALVVAGAVTQATPATTAKTSVTVTNTGALSATGGPDYFPGYSNPPYYSYPAQLLISAGLAVGGSAQGGATVSITNAKGGSIVASGTSSALPVSYGGAGAVGVIASGDQVSLANSGTITGGPDIPFDSNTSLFVSGVLLPNNGPVAGGVQVYATNATLTNNAGAIINGSVGLATTTSAKVTNFGTINGNVTLAGGDDSFTQGIGATVTGSVDAGAGNDSLTIDLTGGGTLDAQLAHFVNFETTRLTGSGTVTATTPLAVDTLVLDNAALTIAAGSTLATKGAVTLTAGTGASAITNFGTIAGKVVLGAGNDTFVEGIKAATGAVDGGAGANALVIDINGGGNLAQAVAPFTNFATLALTGTGTVSGATSVSQPTITLNGASLTLATGASLQAAGGVALTGGTGTNAFTNNGTVNGAIVGVDTVNGAGGTVNIGTSATDNARFVNAAADAALNVNAGTFTLGQKLVNSGLVAVAKGATLVDRAGVSNLAGGRITVASGGTIIDAVDNAGTIVNAGTYNADLNNLAGGSATNASGATWTGALSNAAGATLVNQGSVIGTVTNAGSFTNAAGATVSGALTQGAGSTTNAGTIAGGAVINGGSLTTSGTVNGLVNTGTVSVTGGTITGNVTNSGTLNIASGATVSGQITNMAGAQLTGTLAFGAGNDTLTLMSGAGVTGAIDGGAGTDTLVIASSGTDAAPDEYNLTRITGFEQTTQTSGTIAISGTYTTNQLDVLAGRYIGRTGSVLNAGTVNVAAGATFGSGGTVNGNVNVRGTLAPGGTVGTMTVNGNVTLASGSTALFDVGQAASDQLAVSGTVTIATGATLTLSAVQNNPLKPGSSIDLIVANGGITGSFTTINKPASILGFVVQRATRISLLGQFLADASFSPSATAAVNYVNSILTSGQASGALLNAIPSLLTAGGNTNAAAFAQLTPEAYASATQIGTENGLAIAAAMRRMEAARAPAGGNLFAFAQGLGTWSRISGNAALGSSRAAQNSGGVLGGIGFGSDMASITGFIGTIDGHQSIGALRSRTTTHGTFVGASAHLAAAGFSGTATVAYDMSTADTTRPVPGGVGEQARYRLRSTTFDVEVGYDLPVGTRLALRPEVGFTSVRTKRGTAVETGSAGAFDFTVARSAQTVNFVDAGVRIEAAPGGTAKLRPKLDLGVRHLLDADARFATGYLPGGPAGITVAGATRTRTVATVSAGFDATVAPNVTLFAGYDGAFGKGTSGNRANGGVRVAF